MIIDNNNYFIKTSGLAAGTAWSSLWGIAVNIGDVIDLTSTTNRRIVEGGYVVWQVGTAIVQAHAGTTQFDIVCSAAVGLGTPTILWSSGVQDHAVHEAWAANTIVWAIKLPSNIPLRYLGVSWTPATSAWTQGTMNIYVTQQVPVLPSNVM